MQSHIGTTQAHSICTTNSFKKGTREAARLTDTRPTRVDQTAEWCNSFVIVPKPNGTVHLCVDPVRLHHAFIRPVHSTKTISDILPKLTNMHCMTLKDASSGYCNPKCIKNHLT